ncbi:DUF4410 domain-containing protein [Rhizosaccharibacter radicis]|uniref:DUF4410 domain-containing protein n=1 Tax=Rhizosaccharibacter radicis TaxID=2782605 RepID=A0ABT1W1G7_9PROT|nr:DUF4410 domain-containing protein [Acetobacteraceae bacterium KSS12]
MSHLVRRFPALRSLVLLGSLTGCAGTHVSGETMELPPRAMPPPRSIAIVVSDGSPVPRRAGRIARHLRDVRLAAGLLRQELERQLAAHGLAIASPQRPAELELRCRITEVRSGSEAARLLIGYGAGKAVLRVSAALEVPGRTDRPLLSFSTAGTTGAMPGAGLGAASAAGAAGTALHMVGPALGAVGTLRQGLPLEVQEAVRRTDQELARYFAARGWPYPPPRSPS